MMLGKFTGNTATANGGVINHSYKFLLLFRKICIRIQFYIDDGAI